MPKTFLDDIAHSLYQQYGNDLHRQFIIIPNLRPAIFLRKALTNTIDKPLASPTILSVEEFVFRCVKRDKCSTTESLLRLFHSVNSCGPRTFTIEEFMGLGASLLTDFYETDLYLANPDDLFRYLSDIRKIEQWAPDKPGAPSGENARKYLAFYERLADVYHHFRNGLHGDEMADPALAFRMLADNAMVYLNRFFDQHPHSNLIFAGFNALTAAEGQFMKTAKRMNRAEFYWDADAYYLSRSEQEAGAFFRSMSSELLSDKDRATIPARLGAHPLSIESIETTGNVQQILFAAEKAAEWEEQKTYQREHVAIVLGDETLINDLIQVLPRDANINLTLGVSLDQLQAGQLLFAATRLYKNPGKRVVHHRDLLRVLRHPFVAEWLEAKAYGNAVKKLIDTIGVRNLIYVSEGLIREHFDEDLTSFFTHNDEPLQALMHTEWLLNNLATYWDKARAAHENYEREQTYAALHMVRETRNWVERYLQDIQMTTLADLCWEMSKNETISFRGEPESGIQIMGILETRLLHFDRFTMLSVNEDVIPKGKSQPSLIPNDVKRQFDLPTHSQRDAIFAYHVYHLFHGAKEAHMVHTQGGSGMGNAGPSRFLYQMEWEWTKAFSQAINFEKKLYHSPLDTEQTPNDFSIEKSEDLVDALEKRMATEGISPSALRSYLRDPLVFYREYALGIKNETSEADEDASLPAIGNAVHATLEQAFTPYIGKPFPSKETLRSLKEDAVKRIDKNLQKELGEAPLDSGKNILALAAAREMVALAFGFEQTIEVPNRRIIALENKTNYEEKNATKLRVPMPIDTKYGPVLLSGFIDRLEQWGNDFVYLDYKTGSIGESVTINWPENPQDIDEDKRDKKLGPGIQLLSYALMAGDQSRDFRAGLIGLKRQKDGYRWLIHKDKPIDADQRHAFTEYLCSLIREILYEGTFHAGE